MVKSPKIRHSKSRTRADDDRARARRGLADRGAARSADATPRLQTPGEHRRGRGGDPIAEPVTRLRRRSRSPTQPNTHLPPNRPRLEADSQTMPHRRCRPNWVDRSRGRQLLHGLGGAAGAGRRRPARWKRSRRSRRSASAMPSAAIPIRRRHPAAAAPARTSDGRKRRSAPAPAPRAQQRRPVGDCGGHHRRRDHPARRRRAAICRPAAVAGSDRNGAGRRHARRLAALKTEIAALKEDVDCREGGSGRRYDGARRNR